MLVTEESTNAKPASVPLSADAVPDAKGLSATTQHATAKTNSRARIEITSRSLARA
jgi:hypothetical protein